MEYKGTARAAEGDSSKFVDLPHDVADLKAEIAAHGDTPCMPSNPSLWISDAEQTALEEAAPYDCSTSGGIVDGGENEEPPAIIVDEDNP